MQNKTEKLTTFIIWAIVVGTAFFYIKYFYYLMPIGKLIVSITPALVFIVGGVLIFSRDRKIIRRAKEKGEYTRSIELDWGKALHHDILTYFTPVVILAFPFFFGQIPELVNVFQAIFAFLALSYVKFIYWGEL